jgi:histone deacetylase complex regulatory component SIN3
MRRYEREPFESAATFQEATVRYIGRVKTTFTNQPDVYKEFVDIVREVRRNE